MRPIDADALDTKIYNEIPIKVFGTIKRMAAIREIIAQMPTVGGWISVKDQLPENEQYVILWTKTGVMKYAKYLDDEPHRPWITYDEDGSIRAWDNVVTHWMPLPRPPKGVSGE